MAIFQKLDTTNTEQVINRVFEIPTAKISPNPTQPRIIFDDYELSQLAVSIQQNGILQPLSVRRLPGDCGYELISGERRLRAAKLVGMTRVPCIIIDADDKNSALLAILENIQRSDLNFIEEAYAIRGLIDGFGITQEDAAAKLGIAQSTIANKLRLLKLSDEVKAMALRYRLNERQTRSLLRLPEELRLRAVEKIGTLQLNTAAADKLVEEMLNPKMKRKKRVFIIKQVGLYINTFNHAIDSMKKSGINCVAKQKKTEDFVEYLVRIPLK